MKGEHAQPSRRVLIAEDVEVIGHTMAEILRQAGYEVSWAHDGEACLEAVEDFKPDLLLLDLMMPKLHGIEVLRRLRNDPETRDLGVIVCTAKTFKTELVGAAELGAVGFLPKPVSKELLLGRVRAFFDGELQGPADAAAITAAVAVGEPHEFQVDTSSGILTLWGTRGSIPTPGAAFLRHGGNTSCMAVEYGDDLFVFDAGSGIRELGNSLMGGPPRRIHIFITHTHWDHIQGFPFFTPAYVPGFEVVVYGAEGFGKSLEAVFRGQLDRDYFPVQLEDMRADLSFRNLADDGEGFGDVTVTWAWAQHPGATVGYKIEVAGTRIAWFPDNEFLYGYVGAPEEVDPDGALMAPYRKVVDFLSDVDVLIHEAQYTNDEYPYKIGWGHSSVSNACLLAKLAGVKRWYVTHHDPMHDDAFLETKLNVTRQQLARLGHRIPVGHAYDGLTKYLWRPGE